MSALFKDSESITLILKLWICWPICCQVTHYIELGVSNLKILVFRARDSEENIIYHVRQCILQSRAGCPQKFGLQNPDNPDIFLTFLAKNPDIFFYIGQG